MDDNFEFTLHSPLTKEDWNKISDAEHENTTYVTFQTPQGRQVRYIKCEVLDKIRAEISKAWRTQPKNRYEEGLKDQALKDMQIIDKYKTESEGEK